MGDKKMNDNEEDLMTKAWKDWFTQEEEEDIPEVGFAFRKAWKFQHLRYNLLIDSYEKIIKAMQVRIDELTPVEIHLHNAFCVCDKCTNNSPELWETGSIK